MKKSSSKGLGRGFDSLIPTSFDSSILMDETERIQKLSTDVLQPNPQQPRKHFDEAALNELAASIKRYGILQPIVAMPKSGGGFYVVAGERRLRAAKLAGLKSVPAIVRTSKELERLEIALVENVQRVDLSPLEQAASILTLHDQFSIEYEVIAARLGKAQTTISNVVRLLQLPSKARKALQENQITEGHARAILAFKDETKQLELLGLIISKHWNVRQAEQYVTAHKSGTTDVKQATKRVVATTPATRKLSQLLKTQVTIKRTARGGKLEIRFKSDQELSSLIKRISKL